VRTGARAAVGLGAALLFLWACGAGAAEAPIIRVGLIQSQQQIQVSADAPFAFTDAAEPPLSLPGAAGETWTITTLRSSEATSLRSTSASRPPEGQPPQPGMVWLTGPGGSQPAKPPLRVRVQGEGRLKAFGSCPEHWDGVADRFYRGEFEVTADTLGRLTLVNIVDLEQYALGVLPSEMSDRYPAEALKAQAVAIHSEALASLGRHRAAGFDLCDWVHCQAYGGATSEKPSTDAAVEATRGEALTFGGKVARAVYHAVCGGHTENIEDVWNSDPVPYLRGVEDFEPEDALPFKFPLSEQALRRYLTEVPLLNCYQPKYSKLDRYRWVRVITRQELEKTLQPVADVGTVMALNPLERGASGRIKRLEVVGTRQKSVIGPELVIRKALGDLRSSAFVVDAYPGPDGVPVVFVFWGAGWGHGVGMCQVGAVGLAERGWTYDRILAKYYPGTKIEKRY